MCGRQVKSVLRLNLSGRMNGSPHHFARRICFRILGIMLDGTLDGVLDGLLDDLLDSSLVCAMIIVLRRRAMTILFCIVLLLFKC